MTARDWRSRAACTDVDVDAEIFFPVAESGPVFERRVAVAMAVCTVCVVRAECLAWALAHQPYGIAGGLTAEERRGLGTGAEVSVRLVGPPPATTAGEIAGVVAHAVGVTR